VPLSRAGILLKADTATAGQALQTAIAIAEHQKARSFELSAALALAKLYCAASRDADAHAVLAPAIEGFPPTEQFPELAEAQALLSTLSPKIDRLRRVNHTLRGGRLSASEPIRPE
jgi:predicted ATPase